MPILASLLVLVLSVAAAAAEPAAAGTVASQLFVEREGVVMMEAEHATEVEGWEPVTRDDATGVAMRDAGPKGRARLVFQVLIERPGRYHVWFRQAKPEDATDQSNDCFVTAGGEQLQVERGGASHPVVGMGTHQKRLAFESRPKSHDNADRDHHPFFEVDQRSVVAFEVRSRSPGYLLDAIALVHAERGGDDPAPAVLGDLAGPGPAETVYARRR